MILKDKYCYEYLINPINRHIEAAISTTIINCMQLAFKQTSFATEWQQQKDINDNCILILYCCIVRLTPQIKSIESCNDHLKSKSKNDANFHLQLALSRQEIITKLILKIENLITLKSCRVEYNQQNMNILPPYQNQNKENYRNIIEYFKNRLNPMYQYSIQIMLRMMLVGSLWKQGQIIQLETEKIQQKLNCYFNDTNLYPYAQLYARAFYLQNKQVIQQYAEQIRQIYSFYKCELAFERQQGNNIREIKFILAVIRDYCCELEWEFVVEQCHLQDLIGEGLHRMLQIPSMYRKKTKEKQFQEQNDKKQKMQKQYQRQKTNNRKLSQQQKQSPKNQEKQSNKKQNKLNKNGKKIELNEKLGQNTKINNSQKVERQKNILLHIRNNKKYGKSMKQSMSNFTSYVHNRFPMVVKNKFKTKDNNKFKRNHYHEIKNKNSLMQIKKQEEIHFIPQPTDLEYEGILADETPPPYDYW